MYISMRHDGTFAPVISLVMDEIEHASAVYTKATYTLLCAMGDGDENRLQQELETFENRSKVLSREWRHIRETNPLVSRYRRLTTTGLSPEPPLPE